MLRSVGPAVARNAQQAAQHVASFAARRPVTASLAGVAALLATAAVLRKLLRRAANRRRGTDGADGCAEDCQAWAQARAARCAPRPR